MQKVRPRAVEGRRPIALVGDVIDAEPQGERPVRHQRDVAGTRIKPRPARQLERVRIVGGLVAGMDDATGQRECPDERNVPLDVAVDQIVGDAGDLVAHQ